MTPQELTNKIQAAFTAKAKAEADAEAARSAEAALAVAQATAQASREAKVLATADAFDALTKYLGPVGAATPIPPPAAASGVTP